MDIRAIFFDIDGTLLGKSRTIPASTLYALQAARKKGILLFVATGRVPAMLGFVREMFDFDGYLALTGQYCFDRTGRILHTMPLDKGDLYRLVALAARDPIPCLIAEAEQNFMLCETPLIPAHFKKENLPPPALYDKSRIETNEVYQLITYEPDITNPKLTPLTQIRITNAALHCHDVIPKLGGKHIGIQAVCAQYNIPLEKIMVFGDGRNDVEMLQNTGFGVAMGNGCAAAKAAAHYVTDDVDADGIYNALKHFSVI